MLLSGKMATSGTSRLAIFRGEFQTLVAATIVAIAAILVARLAVPQMFAGELTMFLKNYLGFSWPFFAAVIFFLFYVMGAWIVAFLELGNQRDWTGIGHALHWATEACPLVGLLTTFGSLLTALLAYGEAGPGQPETQAAFITQFAIAFGSSIAGGILALTAFTLHRLLPEDGDKDYGHDS